MRLLLNVVASFTLLASAWLATMYLVLHHPGYERGFSMALLFVIQSLLTLGVSSGLLSASWWRLLAAGGALGIVAAGSSAVVSTLNSAHFEGFALIIGAALALQGLLTIGHLVTVLFTSSSKVHQFGN